MLLCTLQHAGIGWLFACLLFELAGRGGVLRRNNMQAMKPIAGIQVPNEIICATLTPTADNSSIPVSVKYTCMHIMQASRASVAASQKHTCAFAQTFSR